MANLNIRPQMSMIGTEKLAVATEKKQCTFVVIWVTDTQRVRHGSSFQKITSISVLLSSHQQNKFKRYQPGGLSGGNRILDICPHLVFECPLFQVPPGYILAQLQRLSLNYFTLSRSAWGIGKPVRFKYRLRSKRFWVGSEEESGQNQHLPWSPPLRWGNFKSSKS